jgi:hypothetical protein
VRIVSVGEEPVGDVSDAPFAITSVERLTLTAPDGGELWFAGSDQEITWESVGDVDSVTIAYSTDGGESWETIVADTPNNGSYPWTVPATPSESSLVGVAWIEDSQVSDASNSTFTIVGLGINSPNGDEFLQAGRIEEILWSTAGGVGSTVSLSLSTDGGESWETIVANTPNNGSYPWTVPAITCLECFVGVSSTLHPAVSDASDSAFLVGIPAILVDITSQSNLNSLSPEEEALVVAAATASDTGLPVEEGTPLIFSDEEASGDGFADPVSTFPAVLLDGQGKATFRVRGGSQPEVTIVQGKVIRSNGSTVTRADSFVFSFVQEMRGETPVAQCAAFAGPTISEGVYSSTLTISEGNCDNAFEVTVTQTGAPAEGYLVLFIPSASNPTTDFIVLGESADSFGEAAALLTANEPGEETLTVTSGESVLAQERATVCGDTAWDQVVDEFSDFVGSGDSVEWNDVEESYGDYLDNPCA